MRKSGRNTVWLEGENCLNSSRPGGKNISQLHSSWSVPNNPNHALNNGYFYYFLEEKVVHVHLCTCMYVFVVLCPNVNVDVELFCAESVDQLYRLLHMGGVGTWVLALGYAYGLLAVSGDVLHCYV